MWTWLLLVLLPSVRADAEFWLSAPEDHVALAGDIEVSYSLPSPSLTLRLLLVQLVGDNEKPVEKRDVPPKLTKGKIVFPCKLFARAGQFAFKLVTLDKEKVLTRTEAVNVRWPEVIVHVPLMVETYTSNVSIQLYAGSHQCKPRVTYTTFVDLVYEGSSITTWHKPSVLTSKELTGWMWDTSYDLTLECEYFDRAGNYTVRVRTDIDDAPIIAVSDTILVMWSHRYSVSVAKSSVQPCDGSLSVIYHYPRCILDQDRIRVYGKALRGPLKYIRESRIETGKHSTKLSCDIFQDDYQEYCFSFVSTARNGAVFDLKTHCLPTLTDSKLSAIWNNWGPWSECSASCGTGIQSRYRLCLAATNESYCIGKAVQSQQCNTESCSDNVTTTTEQPTVWDCSCGCERNITDTLLLHLVVSECDSNVWWSVQAWPTGHIIIDIISLIFPSSDCWLTIRDGKSPLGTMLAIFSPFATRQGVHSLSNTLRIEVHCGNISSNEIELVVRFTRSEFPRASLAMVRHSADISDSSNLSAVHITIIMLAAVLCTTTAFLILVHSYRRTTPGWAVGKGGSASTKRLVLLQHLLTQIYKLIQSDAYKTKRELYYDDVALYKSQSVVDGLLDDIACLLGVSKTQLHVLTTSKGCIAGRLRFKDAEGSYVDCSDTVRGVLIPNNVQGITNIQSDARFILVVEKSAVYEMLVDSGVTKLLHPCVIVTGKGFPDVNTREMLKKLWDALKIPILGLFDADPYGIEILGTYKYGSKAMAFDVGNLAVPEMRWVGLLPTDIQRLKLPPESTAPLTENDKKKARHLLELPYVQHHRQWSNEVEVMLKSGIKAEIEGLGKLDTCFLPSVYLPNKIKYGGWI